MNDQQGAPDASNSPVVSALSTCGSTAAATLRLVRSVPRPLGGVPPWKPPAREYDDGAATDLPMKPAKRPAPPALPSRTEAESTLSLLARARAGEAGAFEQLFERCIPAVRRWARGRLPQDARSLAETQDLVQEAVLHTLRNLHTFEPRHPGALQAYLRQAVANRIRDEIRRTTRRPAPAPLSELQPDAAPSPLEQAIGSEGLARYEAALARLRPADREAIVARLELQQSYEEVAIALDKPNANAARAAVTRALARLIEELDHVR